MRKREGPKALLPGRSCFLNAGDTLSLVDPAEPFLGTKGRMVVALACGI